MAKKPSSTLLESLHTAAGTGEVHQLPAARRSTKTSASKAASPESADKPLVLVGGRFDENVNKQLLKLGLDFSPRKTTQVLVAEALNLLFVKHGLPPIAEDTPKTRGYLSRRDDE